MARHWILALVMRVTGMMLTIAACGRRVTSAPAGSDFAAAEIDWAAIDSVRFLDLGQYAPRDTVRVGAAVQWWPMQTVGDSNQGVPITTLGPLPFWLPTVARNHGAEALFISPAVLRRGPPRGARMTPVIILGPIQYLGEDQAAVSVRVSDADWRSGSLYTVSVKRGSKSWIATRVRRELQS
jgi:hypothetical protein